VPRSSLLIHESGGGPDGPEPDAGAMKTKVRRLYDICNVLTSLKMISKVRLPDTSKPAFKWHGVTAETEAVFDSDAAASREVKAYGGGVNAPVCSKRRLSAAANDAKKQKRMSTSSSSSSFGLAPMAPPSAYDSSAAAAAAAASFAAVLPPRSSMMAPPPAAVAAAMPPLPPPPPLSQRTSMDGALPIPGFGATATSSGVGVLPAPTASLVAHHLLNGGHGGGGGGHRPSASRMSVSPNILSQHAAAASAVRTALAGAAPPSTSALGSDRCMTTPSAVPLAAPIHAAIIAAAPSSAAAMPPSGVAASPAMAKARLAASEEAVAPELMPAPTPAHVHAAFAASASTEDLGNTPRAMVSSLLTMAFGAAATDAPAPAAVEEPVAMPPAMLEEEAKGCAAPLIPAAPEALSKLAPPSLQLEQSSAEAPKPPHALAGLQEERSTFLTCPERMASNEI
jgi:hypothetical protein